MDDLGGAWECGSISIHSSGIRGVFRVVAEFLVSGHRVAIDENHLVQVAMGLVGGDDGQHVCSSCSLVCDSDPIMGVFRGRRRSGHFRGRAMSDSGTDFELHRAAAGTPQRLTRQVPNSAVPSVT